MKQDGFSLLELSIVLVIIGLIAGGVVSGASMIRAAELRGIITEQQQFKTALHTFKDKYFAIPGDMKNAYAFWNTQSNCVADQVVTETDDTGCNGDGDGKINHSSGEHFKAWTHLSLTELITGNYTGTYTDRFDYQIGENVPESSAGKQWLIYYTAPQSIGYTSGTGFDVEKTQLHHGNSINPTEAYSIDKKVDDGKPGLGRTTAHRNCAISTNADTSTAEYNLADDSISCSFRFSAN